MTTTDIRAADALAVRASIDMAGRVRPRDLKVSTPCRGWNVQALLEHATTQHEGFAAAARGLRTDTSQWEPRRRAGKDVVAAHAAAAEDVLAAIAENRPTDRMFWLPEIRMGSPVPAAQAIGIHLVDCLAHTWDLARALGLPFHPDRESLDLALSIAERIPDGASRREPASPFAPRLPAGPEPEALDRFLLLLGRSPEWTP